MTENKKTIAIEGIGIDSVGKIAENITDATIQGTSTVLGRICLPVAKEIGLWLRDKMKLYRSYNIINTIEKFERKRFQNNVEDNACANPRIIHEIIENCSWAEDPMVQDLWAGLIASSCSEAGTDDSNLIFVNIISQLTKIQALIIRYICEISVKCKFRNGLIVSKDLIVIASDLTSLADEIDIQRLDLEIDQLRHLGLITPSSGFNDSDTVNLEVTPTAVALHMYTRCSGSRLSPVDYFKVTEYHPQSAVIHVPSDGTTEKI